MNVWLQPVLGLVTVATQVLNEVANMLSVCPCCVVSTLSINATQKSVPIVFCTWAAERRGSATTDKNNKYAYVFFMLQK